MNWNPPIIKPSSQNRLKQMLWQCLLFAGLVANINAENQVVLPGSIVNATLAHSLRLKGLRYDEKMAESQQQHAKAQGMPHVSVDAKATRYVGLEENKLGLVEIPAIESRYGAGVSITQPAYTGGRIKSLKEGTAYQKKAVLEEQRGAEADLVLQALTAYWNWSKAYYSGESLQAAVTRMEAHARDLKNLHQAGLATDNEKLTTDVMLDKTQLRREDAQRRVEVALARLAFLTGKPMAQTATPLKPETSRPEPPVAETELVNLAQRNRPERTARQLEAIAAETRIRTEKAERYPQIALIARYEQSRPNAMNIPPKDRWQDDAFAGISLTWNVFDWGVTKAKVSEATARAERAKLRTEQAEEEITLQVREARIALLDALSRLKLAEKVESSARRNLEAATDLWRNGLARHSDVLDAHAQSTDAQYEIIAARADVELNQAALKHATGLLGRP